MGKRLSRLTMFGLAAAISVPEMVMANCWDNESGQSRYFTVCIGDDCIQDELLWECVSGDWSGAAFAGGFSADCSVVAVGEGYNQSTAPSVCIYKIGGYKIPTSLYELLSCTPKQEGDIGCIWWP